MFLTISDIDVKPTRLISLSYDFKKFSKIGTRKLYTWGCDVSVAMRSSADFFSSPVKLGNSTDSLTIVLGSFVDVIK